MPRQDILLETSGLANPNNVAIALKSLDDLVEQGLIIAVNDAKLLQESIQESNGIVCLNLKGIVLSQIECVDILVLNKIDLVQDENIELLRKALKFHNPRALLIESSFGRIPFALLDEVWDAIQQKRQSKKQEMIAKQNLLIKPMYLMNHATHRDDPDGEYLSRCISFSQAMCKQDIEQLINDSGAVRVKGIIEIEGDGLCVVQNAASVTVFSPLYVDLNKEKSQERYLVFIGKHIDNKLLDQVDYSKDIQH